MSDNFVRNVVGSAVAGGIAGIAAVEYLRGEREDGIISGLESAAGACVGAALGAGAAVASEVTDVVGSLFTGNDDKASG